MAVAALWPGQGGGLGVTGGGRHGGGVGGSDHQNGPIYTKEMLTLAQHTVSHQQLLSPVEKVQSASAGLNQQYLLVKTFT